MDVMNRSLLKLITIPLIFLYACIGHVERNLNECGHDTEYEASYYSNDSLGFEIRYPSKWKIGNVDGDPRFFYEKPGMLVHLSIMSFPPEAFQEMWKGDDQFFVENGTFNASDRQFRYVLQEIGDFQYLHVEIPGTSLSLLQLLPTKANNQGFCETKLVLENMRLL